MGVLIPLGTSLGSTVAVIGGLAIMIGARALWMFSRRR